MKFLLLLVALLLLRVVSRYLLDTRLFSFTMRIWALPFFYRKHLTLDWLVATTTTMSCRLRLRERRWVCVLLDCCEWLSVCILFMLYVCCKSLTCHFYIDLVFVRLRMRVVHDNFVQSAKIISHPNKISKENFSKILRFFVV